MVYNSIYTYRGYTLNFSLLMGFMIKFGGCYFGNKLSVRWEAPVELRSEEDKEKEVACP